MNLYATHRKAEIKLKRYRSAAAENEEGVDSRAVSSLEGWIECFPKSHLAGKVFAGGVTDPGEIQNHPALKEACEMDKNV